MRIAYAIIMSCLFGIVQLLTWDFKEIQFYINVILFGLISFNLFRYYEKSKHKTVKNENK